MLFYNRGFPQFVIAVQRLLVGIMAIGILVSRPVLVRHLIVEEH